MCRSQIFLCETYINQFVQKSYYCSVIEIFFHLWLIAFVLGSVLVQQGKTNLCFDQHFDRVQPAGM